MEAEGLIQSISILPVYNAMFSLLVRLFPSLIMVYAIMRIPDFVVYILNTFLPNDTDLSHINNSAITASPIRSSSIGHRPFL